MIIPRCYHLQIYHLMNNVFDKFINLWRDSTEQKVIQTFLEIKVGGKKYEK